MASNLAPPPPPLMGGPPPPPLPPGGLPPPLPGMGMPLPPFVPPGGAGGPGVLLPVVGGGGGPPPRIPFTPTILLTNVPPFLHTIRAVRDWIYPCGSVRNCIFFPRKTEDDFGDPQDLPSEARIAILITMSHPDGACKFMGAFKQFLSRLDDRYNKMQAYMVPANKDVPLPPPLLDEESQQHLGEKLWQNFVAAEAPEFHQDGPTTTTSSMNPDKDGAAQQQQQQSLVQQPLDVEKVAAAAGGNNYDAEEDPLNAPAVLEAVKEFRRKLSKTQSFQKRKRMELVAQKISQMMPRVQAMVEQEKLAAPPPPPPVPLSVPVVPNVPPPLPPGGLSLPLPGSVPTLLPPPPLPPGGELPPPPTSSSSADSGKRGLSNLPAWMTNQEGTTTTAEGDEEPPAKRLKEDSASQLLDKNFPLLPTETHAPLLDFLSSQVQEALGEQEAELIQFLHSHILAGKSTTEMLQELQIVLEDEAPAFLQAVWHKVQQLSSQRM